MDTDMNLHGDEVTADHLRSDHLDQVVRWQNPNSDEPTSGPIVGVLRDVGRTPDGDVALRLDVEGGPTDYSLTLRPDAMVWLGHHLG